MSAKKAIGNRWATAVEGAADILLDTGKTKDEDISLQSTEEIAATTVIPEPLPVAKAVKKAPAKGKDAGALANAPSKKPASTRGSSVPLNKGIPQSDASEKKTLVVSPESIKVETPVMPQPQPIDPIQQALTTKGKRSRGGRQRTYYIDNDVADKITSYAKELDKSESQFLRELLRAVFKMNEQ